MHEPKPDAGYVPGTHVVHPESPVTPAGGYVPAAHVVHTESPAAAVNFPAKQSVHTVACAILYEPAEHETGRAPMVEHELPAGHDTHVAELVAPHTSL